MYIYIYIYIIQISSLKVYRGQKDDHMDAASPLDSTVSNLNGNLF